LVSHFVEQHRLKWVLPWYRPLAVMSRHVSWRNIVLRRLLEVFACYSRERKLGAKHPSGPPVLYPFTRSSAHQFLC
jgi:hypothetical protein